MTMVEELGPFIDTQFSWLIRPSAASPTDVANFFYEEMPDQPDFAVVLFEYPGPMPTRTFKNPFVYVQPRLQVLVRHVQVSVAKSRAKEIMTFLTTVGEQTIGGVLYHDIYPVNAEPSDLGPDNNRRNRAVVNYQVMKEFS